jgi:hypothetical protein
MGGYPTFCQNMEKLKIPSKNHRSNFIKTRKADKQAASSNAMEVSYACLRRNSDHSSALTLANHAKKWLLDEISKKSC